MPRSTLKHVKLQSRGLCLAAHRICAGQSAPGDRFRGLLGWLSKLWPLFGFLLLEFGTYYVGYPKREPNFDNHPLGESWDVVQL